MTTLQGERKEILGLISVRRKRFFFPPKLSDMAWAHTSSYSIGICGTFLGDKAGKA
jgi:hypothetical protein